MTQKTLIFGVLKLATVAGLLAVIVANVNWIDTVNQITSDGSEITLTGRIVGNWDQDTVRFISADTAETITVVRGEQPDGARVTISPGLLTYVKNLDGPLFAVGALLFIVFFICINSRWWFLLRANGLGVTFLEAQKYGWIGLFFNNVIPGATGGDVAKAVYIARRCPGQKIRAIVSIVVDRIVGLLSLIFVGSLASLLAMERFPVFATTIWLTGLAALCFCFLLISPTLRRLIRFEILVSYLPSKIGLLIKVLDQAVMHYRGHLGGIGIWILVSPLIYTLFVGSFFCMAESLGVGIGLADLFFIVPVASVVQGVPIAPAGWGIGEAAYGFLIGKFGAANLGGVAGAEEIMRTRGVALSVLHRIHVAAWSLLGGLFMLTEKKIQPAEADSGKSG